MTILPDMIGMTVRDMAAALRFYRALGLDIPEGAEKEDHVEYLSPNGYRLAWDTEEMMKGLLPDWQAPAGHRMGLAFKVDSPAEVDEVHARLVAAGHPSRRAPYDAFWGQRYATVMDPDGNPVDIFAPLS
jgi:catechol 2,3-dioxygenase-like lactoylglutathione lyase family enzyme